MFPMQAFQPPVSLTPIYLQTPPHQPAPLYPILDPSQHPDLIASAPLMEDDPMDVSVSSTASYPYYSSQPYYHTQNPNVESSYVPLVYQQQLPPPPKLETEPSRVDRAAQITLKLIGGLAFSSISIFLGSATFIAGSTTSLLLAVGNPGCIITGGVTFLFALGTIKCAKTTLEIFKGLGRDCNEIMP